MARNSNSNHGGHGGGNSWGGNSHGGSKNSGGYNDCMVNSYSYSDKDCDGVQDEAACTSNGRCRYRWNVLQDPGEAGIEGVIVHLLDANGGAALGRNGHRSRRARFRRKAPQNRLIRPTRPSCRRPSGGGLRFSGFIKLFRAFIGDASRDAV